MLKSLLPHEIKESNTINDISLRSNLTTNKTIENTKISLLFTIVGFTQSHSGPLNDPPKGYIQKTSGTYKSDKSINITGIDETHSKCHFNCRSFLMVPENQFCTVLHEIKNQNIKYTRKQELFFLKR